MRVHRILTTAAVLAAVAVAGTAVPASARPVDAIRPDHASQAALVAELRAATARFHDVDVAIAEGYLPAEECSASPAGAMGHHFVNPALIAPGAPVDASKPPVLLYGPSASGELEFWGAEFFEPNIGQPTPVFGTQQFDGPMPGHEPGMPEHYDLHVWVGKHNPDGLYAPFNPSVSC
ncbi:hypothetical protein ACFPER_13700 [Agromyces aurantiacus]|uniref:Lipase n=1 Tax=Agromyces aurantiacus TaxID=165814 RepID=A0ABV9RCE9_9MICO|nr:hypothetical protein [Agromyces aurantiacus]MBM7505253.1 hypothetical protein [Agromyces aurantiacus]